MLFNSYVFVGVFLPLTLLGFALAGRWAGPRGGLAVLATASLIFYGSWKVEYLSLLLFSVTGNFMLGLVVEASNRRGGPYAARLVYRSGIAANLALIAWFKYAGFLADLARDLSGWDPHLGAIVLPLGISFFTFQQIAYLGAVAESGRAERNYLNYLVFISFFAHLLAGPIVHPSEILPQLARLRSRLTPWTLAAGLSLFVAGLAKKVLIADKLIDFAALGFNMAAKGASPDLFVAWGSLLSYSLQIYFDFSGYSDMAMGLALLFGIRFPVNFNSPYKATSIIEFWRRWHMTLSRFLRDFIYVPLGGGRCGAVRRLVNLMLTMLIGGLWHGAAWTFVAWGGLHGLYLCLNHGWRKWGPPPPRSAWGRRAVGGVGWLLTFVAVMLAWVLFRAPDWDAALLYYQGLAGLAGAGIPARLSALLGPLAPLLASAGIGTSLVGTVDWLSMYATSAAVLAIAVGLPNTMELFRNSALGTGRAVRLSWHPTRRWAVILGVLAALALAELASPSEFIYFNF